MLHGDEWRFLAQIKWFVGAYLIGWRPCHVGTFGYEQHVFRKVGYSVKTVCENWKPRFVSQRLQRLHLSRHVDISWIDLRCVCPFKLLAKGPAELSMNLKLSEYIDTPWQKRHRPNQTVEKSELSTWRTGDVCSQPITGAAHTSWSLQVNVANAWRVHVQWSCRIHTEPEHSMLAASS